MKMSKVKILGNLLGVIPAAYLLYQATAGNLSANPIQTATVITGRASVYALLISLYCSPIARLLKMSMFHRVRKISGLFAFYYAFAHFIIFIGLDYQFNFSWILPEIRQKLFLQVGLAAILMLTVLAITSVNLIKQRMGAIWKKLQKNVYWISALILLHVALASKGDIIDPAILFTLYLVAMLLRLPKLRSISIKKQPDWLRRINTFMIS